ncbi:YhgE/Pip domain-containing protein [Gordonibacter massiliensis (ex Traore et al. 2017)]|uniref:YhgE/Pip domain-containing protein n=1 Tax=Gordonibacter massiliensis (ex Traore et al. 2017) TaxID=1841863 RepID=A0A842JH08_9ACTN|nr:YhgE/Pip domain-containing protein [Gordonibacter massiliensis (ex Traore et al. 2017)]MBC2889085.1 YhgE/Pip domain-containing protein [Gordonibacter massiliensis (ex Traore et al. 2017)]
MAFKGLRFAGLEWKNITASKVMWVVIAAIAIMPLLYGALYLAAFQDPYARLNTVPVAVVNEDEGAVIAGESRNLGDDVVDEFKGTDDGLGWNFVSADEAQKGLEDGAYFMTCTIPADFSKSVSSVDTSAPEKAQLNIEYNQSENMLASQIGETVWKEVRQRVSDSVATEYWTTVLDRVADSGKDIQTAADGAGTLKDGLVTAQDGSRTITTNLGTLADGATALDSGLGALESGAFTLRQGTLSLVSGANQLKGGAGQVASGAGSVASGAAQLKSEGTSALAAGAGELANRTSGLPDEQKVQEAEKGSAQISGGIAGLQAAAGKLAAGAQGIQGAAGRLSAGVGTSSDQTDQTVYGGANLLAAGIGASGDMTDQTLYGGANLLVAGVGSASDDYTAGTLYGVVNSEKAAVDAAYAALEKGDSQTALKYLAQAKSLAPASVEAASELATGASTLQTGVGTAAAGVAKLQAGVGQVADGIGSATDTTDQTLFGGANLLAAGIGAPQDASTATLYGGLNNLAAGYGSLSSQLLPLVQQSPALREAVLRIDAGANQVNGKMSELASGASQVADGASQVDAGASSAVSGANQLNDGAAQLVSGAASAKDGSTQIASGAGQLKDGSATLTSGLTDAVDGSGELSAKLAEGARTAADQTSNIAGKSEVMSDPVELVNEYYTTVKNYGTGFAPYFMALGLWVGGLVAGFVFKPLNNRLIMSGGSPLTVAFANYLPVAFFSLIQATLLMVVLQFGLQLQIDNVPAFYAMGYLTALVFAAIMQMLMAAFGFPGKFVAIILLMLQLTACAGTFPIQTTPDFFQAINPYMPMTYVVSGMRQIMTGLDYRIVGFDCLVLFAIGAVCFALTCLVAWRKRTVRMDDLHPVLQLG